MKKTFLIYFLFLLTSFSVSASEYPVTSIGTIDINSILTNSKASIDATKQIENIQKEVEDELKKNDEVIMKEREKLIEQQSVMAPEAFEVKVKDFEKKVQDAQIKRQSAAQKLDLMVQDARSKILEELKPILIEYSEEIGITVILEKNSIILSADDMDLTKEVIKRLNKKISKIEVNYKD